MSDDNRHDDRPALTKAAALKYSADKQAAPTLTAKGRGLVAEKIIEVAKAHGIAIQQDADLVNILETVDLDDEIPLEVYAVVAEIFAYLYRTGQARKG